MWHYRPCGPRMGPGRRGRLSTILLNLPSLRLPLMDRTADKTFTVPYWVVTVVLLVVATVVLRRFSRDSSVAFSSLRIRLNSGFLLLCCSVAQALEENAQTLEPLQGKRLLAPVLFGHCLECGSHSLELDCCGVLVSPSRSRFIALCCPHNCLRRTLVVLVWHLGTEGTSGCRISYLGPFFIMRTGYDLSIQSKEPACYTRYVV